MEKTTEQSWPLIAAIDSPDDLKKLPVTSLPEVCRQLRGFLIKNLSTNPGHFASSMGSVDLTVALHYVFNTPYDRIVWDVGHQAYAHKILTGRRDRFSENRKLKGLAGFPTPEESEYDTFAAGHASNSISAALGFAIASQLKGEPKRNVVAVIGDAAISGGMAFEGLNNSANIPNNLLIILNDNDMSIGKNVGGLNSYLARITASPQYNALRNNLYKCARKMRLISEDKRRRLIRFNNSVKSVLTRQQNIFEGLNIRYFGPFDGNDVHMVVKVLNAIKDMEGPRILHLRTIKGKGYAPAENDPSTWHAPGKFDPTTGTRVVTTSTLKYQDVFGKWMVDTAGKDDKLVGITAAMLSGTGLDDMQKSCPERVFDVGISEGHAVTFAAGLAKEGLKPVVAIYSSFLQRAFDQIVNDVAMLKLPVVFAIDRAGLVGEDGATHHGNLDLAYLTSVPNMVVAAPSSKGMLAQLLDTAHSHKQGPFAIRYPRGSEELETGCTNTASIKIGRGQGITMPKQPKAAILSIGTIGKQAAQAVEMLGEQGIEVAHYDMIFLKPIDIDILKTVSELHIPVVTVEDGTRIGGLGATVASWFADNSPETKVHIMGIDDEFVTQGTISQLKTLCGLDARAIMAKVSDVLETSKEKDNNSDK